jgi:hypothetical protein
MPSLAYARDLSRGNYSRSYVANPQTCSAAGGKSCYHLNNTETLACSIECSPGIDPYVRKVVGQNSLLDLGIANPIKDTVGGAANNIQMQFNNFFKSIGGQFGPCPALGKYGKTIPIPCWLLGIFAILGALVILKVR